MPAPPATPASPLPGHRDLYYGGGWHAPLAGVHVDVVSPGDGRALGVVAHGMAADVDAAAAAALGGFRTWRDVRPLERGRILRAMAAEVRAHGNELALLDAIDCGNPVGRMRADAEIAASQLEFFAGLVTEMKGASVPMGPGIVNFTVREPLGVVARIVAFNHPFMFAAARMAAPLAAGNAVILKPPEQAPLSGLRLAELLGPLVPPGTLSVLTGGAEVGAALARHRDVAMITLIGSVATGRAVMREAAERLKPVLLELGGKNALIACADADPDVVAQAAIDGMNFGWCGQSCGSTSRAFLHADIHDAVVERIRSRIAVFRPGLPTDDATTMGAIISRAQYERVLGYIAAGHAEGAKVLCGGGPPADPALAGGWYIEPTVFTGVRPDMRIAREEIFGPILAVLSWRDEADMLAQVNGLDYGLTGSIWTRNLAAAHRLAAAVEAGFIWVNEVGPHFLGAPFGGYKQSGLGREESLGELLAFTQEKNIHINLTRHP